MPRAIQPRTGNLFDMREDSLLQSKRLTAQVGNPQPVRKRTLSSCLRHKMSLRVSRSVSKRIRAGKDARVPNTRLLLFALAVLWFEGCFYPF